MHNLNEKIMLMTWQGNSPTTKKQLQKCMDKNKKRRTQNNISGERKENKLSKNLLIKTSINGKID